MERLPKLLFELSSPERMGILLELERNRFRLSQLARKLNLTVTEASRHLSRLSEARLIQKSVDGSYRLTDYGRLVLSQLSGINFLTKHQGYFLEYDTSCLPYEFAGRIGELENAEFGDNIYGNLESTENGFREAEEFIWVLTDQIVKALIPPVIEKVKHPFDFRFICPEAIMPSDDKAPLPSTFSGVQKRVLPKVNMIVIVTDKASGFCLPHRNGKLDYRNFSGTDVKFRKWCKDLFLHYWNKARPFVSQ